MPSRQEFVNRLVVTRARIILNQEGERSPSDEDRERFRESISRARADAAILQLAINGVPVLSRLRIQAVQDKKST